MRPVGKTALILSFLWTVVQLPRIGILVNQYFCVNSMINIEKKEYFFSKRNTNGVLKKLLQLLCCWIFFLFVIFGWAHNQPTFLRLILNNIFLESMTQKPQMLYYKDLLIFNKVDEHLNRKSIMNSVALLLPKVLWSARFKQRFLKQKVG